MIRRCPLPAGLLTFAFLLLASPAVDAAGWDRSPELPPGERVAIKKRFDGPRYDELRSCYKDFDSRVGATLFAAMVDVTAESGSRSRKASDAKPYARALFDEWSGQGRIDPETGVLIVFGLQNRAVAIEPGSKWKALGFDAKIADRTIASSLFEHYRRRARYVSAICSLASDVDLTLVQLQRDMKTRVSHLQERLPRLDKKLAALSQRVDAGFDGDGPFGERLLTKLAAARAQLDDAKALAKDQPNKAVHLADEVEATLKPVRDDIARFNRLMSALDKAGADIVALRHAIEARDDRTWRGPQAALDQLGRCEALADEMRAKVDGDPARVRDCVEDARTSLARADVRYFYVHTVLPLVALGVVLALGGLLVFLRRRRRRRALRQLEPELSRWRGRVGDACHRLDTLERRYPSHFQDAPTPWRGESAEVDQRARAAADRAAKRVGEARDVLARAEELRANAHPLDASRPEQALRLLLEARVDDLDEALDEADEQLQAVAQARRRLEQTSQSADEAAHRAIEGFERRGELGLSAVHLAEPLDAALAVWDKAKRLACENPVCATSIFDEATALLGEVTERAELGNDVVDRVQGPLAEMGDEMTQRLRQLRFARIDLDQLSFDPAAELDLAKSRAVRVVELVGRAREDEAAEMLDALQIDMRTLAARLEAIAEAREAVPSRMEALEDRSKELKARLLQTRYTLRLLAPANNAEAFHRASDRLGRYHARINRLPKLLAEPREHYEQGRYFLATQGVGEVESLFEAAEALLDSLADIDQRVEQTRAQCAELLEVCEPLLHDLQERVKRPQVDAQMRRLVAEQAVSFQLVSDRVNAEQTNWLEARDELGTLLDVVAFLSTEADADLQAPPSDVEATRTYRRARVQAMTCRAGRVEPTTLGTLGGSSSWADSVATVDESSSGLTPGTPIRPPAGA